MARSAVVTLVMPIYLRALEDAPGVPMQSAMAMLSHRSIVRFVAASPLLPVMAQQLARNFLVEAVGFTKRTVAAFQAALLLGLWAIVLPHLAFAAASKDVATTYRTTVSEVRVTFFATDQDNRPVDEVGRDDFAIVDNGIVVRDFRSLARSDETALDVVVLIDASESVAPRFERTVNEISHLVAQRQLADDGNISVISFGGLKPIVICNGSCRTAEVDQKLIAVKAAGATPLFDALTQGATLIAGRRTPGIRPVLILFSDGQDNISRASALDALDAIITNGALLYTVDLNKNEGAKGSDTLQRMAEATGGRYFSIREGAGTALRTALQDLRSSYVVTYNLPSREGGFHSLRILPKHHLSLRFHCRNGYYYEPSIP